MSEKVFLTPADFDRYDKVILHKEYVMTRDFVVPISEIGEPLLPLFQSGQAVFKGWVICIDPERTQCGNYRIQENAEPDARE